MKQKFIITTILVIGILLLVNFLSSELHFRIDLTETHQYTLSRATLDILENLEEPVTIKAYFSKNLPANVGKTRQDFQDLLVEYANRSDDMIIYEFIDPNESEASERQAGQNGIQPVMINVRERDQAKQQKAFLGATIAIGERKEVIPFIQPGAAMEYALSTAIKKISVTSKPVVGFISGHGEPALSNMQQAVAQLSVLYDLREIRIDSSDVPANIRTIAIIAPMDSIPAAHLQRLDQFLNRGGNMLVAINRVTGDLQRAYGFAHETGLERWLAEKGVTVDGAFLVDAKCGSITVQQQQGFFTMQSQVAFPFLPLVSSFADHAITRGLETVLFEFVSPVSFSGDTTKKFIPIVFSSEHANIQPAPVRFDINRQWTEADLNQQSIPLAAILEGKLAGNTQSKMVVIGDGNIVINGSGEGARQLQPDNVSLAVNAIDWLADDTGLIDLRTKNVTSRPIIALEDSTKSLLKYLNFLLPLVLVIVYGLVRLQRNNMTRLKRMNENYEEY